jgi:hypothetical protein
MHRPPTFRFPRTQGIEVSSFGKNLEHHFGQGHPLGRAFDVDERRLADNRDFLFDRAHAHLNIHSYGLVDCNDDFSPGNWLKTLELKVKRIDPRLKR